MPHMPECKLPFNRALVSERSFIASNQIRQRKLTIFSDFECILLIATSFH